MNRWLILVSSLIALPCAAQFGYYGGQSQARTSEEQETLREINSTLQNVRLEMMAVSQNAGTVDLATQKKLAERLSRFDAELKKQADPSGLKAALTSLMTTIHGGGMQLNGVSGSDLKAVAGQLSAIDKELADFVGPEVLGKMRNVRREGSAKGNLGAFRSALSIFYGDKEGKYPEAVADLIPKYLAQIPALDIPNHSPSSEVRVIRGVQTIEELKKRLKDSGQWLLVTDSSSKIAGTIVIDCTHIDNRGVLWNSY